MNNRNVHFVGSVKLEDASAVFVALSKHVGSNAARFTDGETGERSEWIRWQAKVFESHPELQFAVEASVIDEQTGLPVAPKFRLRAGCDLDSLEFSSLGYANVALESYADFVRLREADVVPSGVRFQVSLPTPLAVVSAFIVHEDAPLVERAYDRAMQLEVQSILAGVNHDDLAIQWDVCLELTAYDGGRVLYESDPLSHARSTIAKMMSAVPVGVDVGVHLCYGDAGHKHIIEPRDLGSSVVFANAMNSAAPRPLAWLHMAVPRDRDDPEYFAPLAGLESEASELVLGLIHLTDGLEGARRRVAAAETVVVDFGVATECGFGRRPVNTIAPLLDLHVAAATLSS